MSAGTYRVWCEAWTDEEHATEICATDACDAAERYVESNFDEPLLSALCAVITPAGLRLQVRVDVLFDPTFAGREVP